MRREKHESLNSNRNSNTKRIPLSSHTHTHNAKQLQFQLKTNSIRFRQSQVAESENARFQNLEKPNQQQIRESGGLIEGIRGRIELKEQGKRIETK